MVKEIACVFVKNEEGKYCLVFEENRRRPTYGTWGPPAEKIEKNERDIEAAQRAMREEAGLLGYIKLDPVTVDTGLSKERTVFFYYVAEFMSEIGRGDHKKQWFTTDEICSRDDIAPYVPSMMRNFGLI